MSAATSEIAFLNSAGSSLPTPETLNAVVAHLRREAEIGGYLAADEAAPMLQQARADLGRLIGVSADSVALAPSDSAAWVKAWWGWVLGGNVADGSIVLVDRLSYHSHYAAITQTQRLAQFEIQLMPSHPDGTVDVDALSLLESSLSGRCSVICLTMIGTHVGNVNPVAEVGAFAAKIGALMFVDGCQALGQLQVDMVALGCHLFTGTGRKWLRAPRGTGLLWVDPSIVDQFQPPGIDGTSSNWDVADGFTVHPGIGRFEEFETSIASQLGLGAAARQAVERGMNAIERDVLTLADHMRAELGLIDRVTVHDTAARRCGIVTFSVDGVEPGAVVAAAARNHAMINSSSANWASLDMHAKGITQVVRVSAHYFNTVDQLGRVTDAIRSLL
jgi:selenocysteine lyase/cysteine desulfurase